MLGEKRLQSFVGRRAGKPMTAHVPVNEAMIRHWCEALGDHNSVYTDSHAAARSIHGGVVAPPAMLQVWTMKGLDPPPPDPDDAQTELIRTLSDEGFTAIVATNCEQEYYRYLRPGDVITATTVIDSVSAEKKTALGPGHFFTTKITYTDQDGEVVGTQQFRLLKYRPAESAPAAKPARRPRPAINSDTEFFWEGLKRGELLAQRCASCGALRHPPRPMCGACRSLEWKEERLSGRGEVYSFVVHHYPEVPPFEVPYVVALIQLEEGVRIISNVIGVPPAEMHIGMPVEVSFEAVEDDLTLPLFSPRSA
jgi:3-oxo-4,17-pregnadiene-20-carboxyl-CoA hydratase alpha subunit